MSFGCCPSLGPAGLLRNRRALGISPRWGVFGVLAFVLWLGPPPKVWSQSIVATIPVGDAPIALAINKVTNKVYVANGDAAGIVTIVDGVTRAATTVSMGPGTWVWQ